MWRFSFKIKISHFFLNLINLNSTRAHQTNQKQLKSPLNLTNKKPPHISKFLSQLFLHQLFSSFSSISIASFGMKTELPPVLSGVGYSYPEEAGDEYLASIYGTEKDKVRIWRDVCGFWKFVDGKLEILRVLK